MNRFPSNRSSRRRCCALFAGIAALIPLAAHADAVAVTTQHNDNARTGDNLHETVLNPSNVNTAKFGKLFAYTLNNQTFSQPLYVPGIHVSVDSALHNVVFVTTTNGAVYAYDADNPSAHGGHSLWEARLVPSGARPVNRTDENNVGACGGNYNDFAGNFGIVGTPVIDAQSLTLYVVVRTIENGAAVQRLHALSLYNGKEKFNGPTVITASQTVSGTTKTFNSLLQNQRPALLLADKTVYITYSSHCDNGGYNGWVLGYSAADISKQVAVWDDTARGNEGGIWQSGQGPSADAAGNVYFITGNGSWDGSNNFGESFVKLASSATGALSLADYFTPSNYAELNNGDTDLGAGGALLIPGTSLMVGGGKAGVLYMLATTNLGQEHDQDSTVQEFQATFPPNGGQSQIQGSPTYFDAGTGRYVYIWGTDDYLRAYQFTPGGTAQTGAFNTTAVAASAVTAPQTGGGDPGGFLSVSANGTSNGIVWALAPYDGDANQNTVPGILYAYDAARFTGTGPTKALTELWDSKQTAARDDVGQYAKFTYPTVANGKVYVASWGTSTKDHSGQLIVYGLLPSVPKTTTPR